MRTKVPLSTRFYERNLLMQYRFGNEKAVDPKARDAGTAGDYANHYTEYAVTQKPEGKYRLRRLLLIALYILYPITFMVVCASIQLPMLIIFTPVTLWMLIFFTWRYVSVEHEYMIASGTITFVDIFGGRSRRVLFSCEIRDMMQIAPLTEESLQSFGDAEVIDLRGSVKAEDGYFFTIKDKDGQKAAVLFEATEKAVKILKYYNPVTVVSSTLRR